MLTLMKIKTDHPDYSFVEELLHLSFPEAERRDDDAQREQTDRNPQFNCHLITDETEKGTVRVGLITTWNLNGFTYVEHLATSPDVRNQGYGRKVMEELKQHFPGLIVLEVEKPETDLSIRRIGFYRRCGFSLCEKEYIQPAYRKGGEELPLFLMYTGTDTLDPQFETVRDNIHREVYGVVR